MGYYIETGAPHGKAAFIAREYDGMVVTRKEAAALADDPEWAPICVVDNGPFEAAAFCYSPDEYRAFNDPYDWRPKTWLKIKRATAEKLTGYVPRAAGGV